MNRSRGFPVCFTALAGRMFPQNVSLSIGGETQHRCISSIYLSILMFEIMLWFLCVVTGTPAFGIKHSEISKWIFWQVLLVSVWASNKNNTHLSSFRCVCVCIRCLQQYCNVNKECFRANIGLYFYAWQRQQLWVCKASVWDHERQVRVSPSLRGKRWVGLGILQLASITYCPRLWLFYTHSPWESLLKINFHSPPPPPSQSHSCF